MINLPLDEATAKKLRAGDIVKITGTMYTARDSAHKRLVELIEKGEALPFDLTDAIIYYVGPTPAKPGDAIGAAGPTTSYRMDSYAPLLIEKGLRGMIGKGERSQEVCDAMQKFGAVYFAATGGTAALLSKCIKSCEVIAYDDLGPEAIHRIEVENFPCIVAQDSVGGNVFAR